MDIRQMEYAVAVADELNFTRAAARCSIGQSGLSHQIGQLERELGTPLFDRTSRRVRMTPAGEAFVAGARRVLRILQEVGAEISVLRGDVRGALRVGTIPVTIGQLGMLGLLRDFEESYPAVELNVTDIGSVTAAGQLLTGDLEIAVLGLHDYQLPRGLSYHLLQMHPLVAVVGRQHRLRGTGGTDLADLADDRFLDSSPDAGLRLQVDAAFARARTRRRSACVLQSTGDLASLALEGIGVTVVPRPVAETIVPAEHADCVLRLSDPQALQPLALSYRDPAPTSPAAQAFLRLALTRLVTDDTR